MSVSKEPRKIHEGRNLQRLREMMGFKQIELAKKIGSKWSQKKISQVENSETIAPPQLEEIAKALNVPADVIRTFDEEKVIYNIQNNYDSAANNVNYQCNSLQKIVELYEAILKSEREKVEILQNSLRQKDQHSN